MKLLSSGQRGKSRAALQSFILSENRDQNRDMAPGTSHTGLVSPTVLVGRLWPRAAACPAQACSPASSWPRVLQTAAGWEPWVDQHSTAAGEAAPALAGDSQQLHSQLFLLHSREHSRMQVRECNIIITWPPFSLL